MLEIRNLHAIVEGEELDILKGVNLKVNKGEIHAIMGPNGSGKSTLSKVVSGHPEYEVTEGTISFEGEDITEKDADERAHLGLFLAFQYPVEVPGITNKTLLREAYNTIARANEREELDPLEFEDYLVSKLEIIEKLRLRVKQYEVETEMKFKNYTSRISKQTKMVLVLLLIRLLSISIEIPQNTSEMYLTQTPL